MHSRKRLWVLMCLIACGGMAVGADYKPQIDKVIQPIIDQKKAVGIVVGILTPDERQVFGYGLKKIGGQAPDGDTIYEIGSITKVFTTLLLADMAEDGLVKLEDPVRLYLPEDVKVPTRNGKEIRLFDLATHTSGLPRMPSNFWWHELMSRGNPYVGYKPEHMFAFLKDHKLRRDIGAEYEYSNYGMGLLGVALARKAGMRYEDLVVKRICDPLKMNDTRLVLDGALRERLAPGHSRYGVVTSNWDFDAFAGAGAIRSSANDMLKFAAANLGLEKFELLPAMETCHQARAMVDNPDLRIGLGWHIFPAKEEHDKVVWHNGGTGGYHSFLGLTKKSRTAVIVFTNSQYDVDEAALKILRDVLNGRAVDGVDKVDGVDGTK